MPPSHFAVIFVCMWRGPTGGSLCISAERLDVSQFSGAASNEEERRRWQGRLLPPSAITCSSGALKWWLHSHLQPLGVFKSTKYPWIPKPALCNRMGSSTKDEACYSLCSLSPPALPQRVLETFWSGTAGPFGQNCVGKWFLCVRTETFQGMKRPASPSDMFSRVALPQSPQNAGYFLDLG